VGRLSVWAHEPEEFGEATEALVTRVSS